MDFSKALIEKFNNILKIFRNMFPENIIQATFQQVQTNYVAVKPKMQRAGGNTTLEKPIMKPILEYTNEMNVLGRIDNKYP